MRQWQGDQLIGQAFAGTKGLQLLFHGSERGEVFILRVIAAAVGNDSRVAEPGQHVDMRIGVIAGQFSMLQPEETLDAEQFTQARLQPGTIISGVPA